MPTWTDERLRDLLRPDDEEDAERLMRFVAWAFPVVVGIVALVAGILETIF